MTHSKTHPRHSRSRTITANEILAGTITGAEIAADAIDASHIKAGAITTSKVSADFGETLDSSSNEGINMTVRKVYTDMDALVGYRMEIVSTSDMLSLMAAIAQDESHSNSENHLWAVQKRYERGEYRLGNNQLLGYDADEDGKPVPNGDAWIVRMVFQLFVDGKTVNEIVQALEAAGARGMRSGKALTKNNVGYILRNEVYVGDRLLQKRHPKNYLTKKPDPRREKESYYMREMHEGLIDRETWERAQARLAAEDKARERERAAGIVRRRKEAHFLAGRVFCEECGCALCRRTFQEKVKRTSNTNGSTSPAKQNYRAWKCKGRMQKSEKGSGESSNSLCTAPIVRENALLAEIQRQLMAAGIACEDGEMEDAVKRHVGKVLVGKSGITVVLTKVEAA